MQRQTDGVYRMKKMTRVALVWLLPFLLFGQKMGTLSVVLFSDGEPLESNEIRIDGQGSYRTDSDGAIQLALSAGRHLIEIYGKDEQGNNLGYFKKPLQIKEEQDTQVIATLSLKGPDNIDIDTPLDVVVSKSDTTKAKGEGLLHGKVRSSEGGVAIGGARVFVRGTAVDTRTDEAGNFTVKIPAGKEVSISVVHSAYSAQTIDGILVQNGATVSKTIKLTPASMELEEFVVLAPKVQGSIADVMAEEKEAKAVVNILSSEEMSKKGDSDAASAIKRVTGVTLIGGKDVYVRGLGGRYSNVEMNSLPLPSPDPTRRAVPLDIFPANVIGSMKIQKSGTADIPASFGGGYVDIRTKEKSIDDYIQISIGGKMDSDTGISVLTYKGSDTDYLGYDDGYREIDAEILDFVKPVVGSVTPNIASSKYNELRFDFAKRATSGREYNLYEESVSPGMSLSIEGAKNIDQNEHEFTIFGNYGYNQEHSYDEEQFKKVGLDYNGNINEVKEYGVNTRLSSSYGHGGIVNIGYSYVDILKLKYTKLYTRDSEKRTKTKDGILGSNEDDLTYYQLEWEERTLSADQFAGEFDYEFMDSNANFQFGIEDASANLYQPNNIQYQYEHAIYNKDVFFKPELFTEVMLKADDTLSAFYLRNSFDFLNIVDDKDTLEIGITQSNKDRESRKQTFGLQAKLEELAGDMDTILEETLYNLQSTDTQVWSFGNYSPPEDLFDANVKETDIYGIISLHPASDLDIVFGARMVDLEQKINNYSKDSENIIVSERSKIIQKSKLLIVDDIFSSLDIKYLYDENNHYDLAFSQTFILPDLRETTEGYYLHPIEIAKVQGNPDLVNTTISSIDLKYSHYISSDENIKLGLFFKRLKNPIEDTIEPTSSPLPLYSFANAKEALMYGLEVDGRKGMGFISSFLQNVYLSGNFSYTDSNVTLYSYEAYKYTTDNRQLQGLSQTVLNLALAYELSNRSLSLSYNKMGERIRKVGLIQDALSPNKTSIIKNPDSIEVPPEVLDLVWIEKYGYGLSSKIKLGNILDDTTIWRQGDSTVNEFKTGRTYSFSVSYKYD